MDRNEVRKDATLKDAASQVWSALLGALDNAVQSFNADYQRTHGELCGEWYEQGRVTIRLPLSLGPHDFSKDPSATVTFDLPGLKVRCCYENCPESPRDLSIGLDAAGKAVLTDSDGRLMDVANAANFFIDGFLMDLRPR